MISMCIKNNKFPSHSLFDLNNLKTVIETCNLYIYNVNEPPLILDNLISSVLFKNKKVTVDSIDDRRFSLPPYHSSIFNFPTTSTNSDNAHTTPKGIIGKEIIDKTKIPRGNPDGFYNYVRPLGSSQSKRLPSIDSSRKSEITPKKINENITFK